MDKAKLKQLAEQYTEEYYFETPVQFFMAGADIATRETEKENAELKTRLENIRYYLDNLIPHELINEATTIIYKMV